MILTGSEIRRRLEDPNDELEIRSAKFEDSQIQPSSVDLRLGPEFIDYYDSDIAIGEVDLLNPPDGTRTGFKQYYHQDDPSTHTKPAFTEPIRLLESGEFILAHTEEYIVMPPDLTAIVAGKSSLARQGFMPHPCAGYIDPGFRGNITLELYNLRKKPLILRQDMLIAQLVFFETVGDKDRYNGKYQNSNGVVPARKK